jgi:(S)-sulfolactate dehydrogenase
MRIVISEFMDEAAVDSLRRGFDVHYAPALVNDRPSLLALLAQAQALIVRNRTLVDAALLESAPCLQVVGRLGVGLDNIDLAACESRGVAVFPATGANALAVAEYVICNAMMLVRGAWAATPAVAAGDWPREALSAGREIAGRTLGLIGFGGIGQMVAARARALGMTLVATGPCACARSPCWLEHGVEPVGLDALLAVSDVVSLHVPLTTQTRKLIDRARLAAMKPGAVLINTSRGGIVDEAALANALHEGRLAGAALDVFEQEPLPKGLPACRRARAHSHPAHRGCDPGIEPARERHDCGTGEPVSES